VSGKFEVYRDSLGQFRWRLKAGNGEPIASGEAYDTKSSALRATGAVQRAASGAEVTDLTATTPSPAPAPNGSTVTPHPGVDHVVVLVQENHTTDNYFSGLAPWGVNVATGWQVQPNPPVTDQPHDRSAYYKWLTTGKATRAAFDTLAVLPYYSYLALTGAFLENHCAGFGTNSTPNHLMIVGGQSPTMRNPPRTSPPVWDLPSLPGTAQDHGVSWRCYCPYGGYPVSFYSQLQGSPNVTTPSQFVTDVKAGTMAALSMIWHASPDDEHPPADVTLGQNAVRAAVDAVVAAGNWDRTVFLLTWDDWGGWDDHVATPNVEHTSDGVQCAYGARVPLLMFGGPVPAVIDSRWNSHVAITKTALQLLGLPALGVPRVDDDTGLVDLVSDHPVTPPPPPAPATAPLPPAPTPTPAPHPPPPPPTTTSIPTPECRLRNGATLPAPNDVPV
jgi:uncharacterized protein YegP (UPF0339 family)